MDARLPKIFSFKSANDLVRIGRENDGGYLVSQSDIDKSDLLIGLGIHDDWSFEEDFTNSKNVEVYAYDASVNEKFFRNKFLKSLPRIYQPKIARNWLKVYLGYRKFFSKSSNHHIEKFVGLNSQDDTHCTLSSIFDDLDHQNIFLKIDVESSEYRFLDTIIASQNRISGLVLELHDCDLHLDTIESFISRFDLKLAHIHANNYAPIRLDDGLPLALELTFSKHCEHQSETSLPHNLDMPNRKSTSEITLVIEN